MVYHFTIVGDVGDFSSYHVGDDAMLDANLHHLRSIYPEISFTVLSRNPESTAQYYGVQAFPLFGPVEELAKLLASSDGLIVSGGGNMSSTWADQLNLRIELIESAYQQGKPVAVLGQTIGPYLSSRDYLPLCDALTHANIVGLREQYSVDLIRALNVPKEKVHYQLDDAFFLPELIPDLELPHPFIGVTVHPFVSGTAHSHFVEHFARQLDEIANKTNTQILLIPHVANIDLGAKLAQLMETPAQVLDIQPGRIVRWITGQASMVISTRYHPLVFALSSAVPCLGLYTDEYTRIKIRGALAHARLEDWSLSISGLVTEAALELWHKRDDIKQHLLGLKDLWQLMHEAHWLEVCAALNLNSQVVDNRIDAQITPIIPDGDWYNWQQIDNKQKDYEAQNRHTLIALYVAANRYSRANKTVLEAREQELVNLQRHTQVLEQSLNAAEDYAQSNKSVLEAREQELVNLQRHAQVLEQSLNAAEDYANANANLIPKYSEEIALLRQAFIDAERYALSTQTILDAREAELANLKVHAQNLVSAHDEAEHYSHSLENMIKIKEDEISTLYSTLAEQQKILNAYKNSFIEE